MVVDVFTESYLSINSIIKSRPELKILSIYFDFEKNIVIVIEVRNLSLKSLFLIV